MTSDSFPRLAARTMNFRLGLPKGFAVSPDGQRVVFLRSPSGTERAHALWVYDVAEARERLVADPVELLGAGDEELTVEEQARRERLRVTTSGVVAFSTDDDCTTAAFALSSRLFVADLTGTRGVRELATAAPVVDPHLDPTGRRIAYAGDRALHVVDLDTGDDRALVGPGSDEPEEVVWGLAEFVAAEELDRARGFWWAPDGGSLLVERYDESPVVVWHIADPAHPERDSGFIVLGMGKLGAFELNYSSDVDLILLFDPDKARSTSRRGPQAVFTRLAQDLVQLLSEHTAQGYA
ncbi:MAG: DPP IV N-terminal domain-containing protein, partial [Jatrophihabitans sp.]|uniref:DPP IV N-terminal domain-containing protein n=1 Tax=Jatrophihabitans sp. TaxID=1932789 RepID=UPI003F7F558B